MQNVLASVRECAPELADAIGRTLGVLLDLYTVDEVRALIAVSQARRQARLEVFEMSAGGASLKAIAKTITSTFRHHGSEQENRMRRGATTPYVKC